jgi:hypothetical protein
LLNISLAKEILDSSAYLDDYIRSLPPSPTPQDEFKDKVDQSKEGSYGDKDDQHRGPKFGPAKVGRR